MLIQKMRCSKQRACQMKKKISLKAVNPLSPSVFRIYQLLLRPIAIHEAPSTLSVDKCCSSAIHARTTNALLVRHKPLMCCASL